MLTASIDQSEIERNATYVIGRRGAEFVFDSFKKSSPRLYNNSVPVHII